MRRFLDWTAAQQADGRPSSSDSQQQQQRQRDHHHQQQLIHHRDQNTPVQSQQPANQQTLNPLKELEIQHLSKLLHEIKYNQASSSPLPSSAGSQSQREFVELIHKTLPLFLNAFGNAPNSRSSSVFTLTESQAKSASIDHPSEASPINSTLSSRQNSPLPPRQLQLDRFPDLLPFAFTVARLFVSEVRQRASNKHAEEASLAILQFINYKTASHHPRPTQDVISTSDETPQGWNLLLSLNTLALSQNPQIIQCLCDASLPSTLIKCLYLFFDLPNNPRPPTDEEDSSRANEANVDHLFSREITQGPLIKAFTQLLVQLCSHQFAIDELIKKDDLRLLIGIASSQCSLHNRPWRRTAFQTLSAISKNMKDNFQYLEQNMCLQVYVDNLHRINSLGLATNEELVDMIRNLLEFLYNLDVNNRNQAVSIVPLIEQFKSSRLVDLIEELLSRIDEMIMRENSNSSQCTDIQSETIDLTKQPSVCSELGTCLDENRRSGRRLIQSLTTLAKINTLSQEAMNKQVLSLKPISRFEMLESFKMPKPSQRHCILNDESIRLFKTLWNKLGDVHLNEAILDATISLFNDDKFNYFIFEASQLLVYYMTSHRFKAFPFRMKQKLFKFLEFIIIEMNYICAIELGTLGTIIRDKTSSNTDLVLGLKTLIACLRFNSKFNDIFREIGLLEVIIELLIYNMNHEKLKQNNIEKSEVLYLLLEASQYLLAGPNNINCTQFNESGAARHVFNCLAKLEFFHLFIPTHSSSSDDGGITVGCPVKFNTPSVTNSDAAKINLIESQSHSQNFDGRYAIYRPSIKQLQKVSFNIIRQLILSSAGDEHLANLLGLLARNLDDIKKSEYLSETAEGESKAQLNFTFLVSQEVNLKICILKSLMIILKDSHRCRTLFRKAGGFIYIVSCLETLAKSLPSPESINVEGCNEHFSSWRRINSRRIWRLIKNSLKTIVIAMRLEPVNLRVFSDEVLNKFIEAIRDLGCFRTDVLELKQANKSDRTHISLDSNMDSSLKTYIAIFLSPPTRDYSTLTIEDIKPEEACCQIFRFLYDMSLDMADGTTDLELQFDRQGSIYRLSDYYYGRPELKSLSFDQETSRSSNVSVESGIFKRRSHQTPKRPPSLDLKSSNVSPAFLTFPCIIVAAMDLIPSCPNPNLMVFFCNVIKSLFRHERNQQLLCEAGLISKLLGPRWCASIMDKRHILHELSTSMLEQLTRHSFSTKEMRMYMRLGKPLLCKNLDEIETNESCDETKQKLIAKESSSQPTSPIVKPKEKISNSRTETLVAMLNAQSQFKSQPPFVEFDMCFGNFSSIFMPSIAPINAKSLPPNASSFLNSTLDIHINEKNGILGGVGSTERQFPPTNGLTYSTWIYIERFPTRSSDPSHNLRLLTIYRGSAATGKEYSCFKVQISALDRAFIISTQESLLFDNESRNDNHLDPDCNVRIWTPELLVEGKWHHIAIVLGRPQQKQSSASVYVDGVLNYNQRICYISNLVGSLGNDTNSSSSGVSAAAFVNAFIGSLPQMKYRLNTQWKQGPCHLVEDALSANFISVIYAMGPSFIGNFQSPHLLSEVAKVKAQSDSKSFLPSLETAPHKALIHQQSTSVTSSSGSHSNQLTRVASSQLSASTSSAYVTAVNSPPPVGPSNFQVSEDKILMSIDARATSLMTLSRMRRIYTRFDCRQVSRVLGLTLHENSTPIFLLHNTGVHLNGPSRGVGALTLGHNQVRYFVPNPTESTIFNLGGCYLLLGLIAQAETNESFSISLKALVSSLIQNPKLQSQMDNINGYQLLSVMFWKKKHLLSSRILGLVFSLITDSRRTFSGASTDLGISSRQQNPCEIHQISALRDLVCECFDLWLNIDMIDVVLEFIYNLISSSNADQSNFQALSNSIRSRNLKFLRDMDLLPRMLRLLPRYDSHQAVDEANSADHDNKITVGQEPTDNQKAFDTKAVYLIKHTVFELLNRTPRQSDMLYFGQFLASLLPTKNKERQAQTISLRNILLKSLLQMMTRNNQNEVNRAMQETLSRILGFDWFMLFICGPHLDDETIIIGMLNLMIILSNDELYNNFKQKQSPSNGNWLKEPVFPTIDGKFNIQLLGINVGVFFGLSGRRKSIKQEFLDAPNYYLLTNCLVNLARMPRIYLILFQTMMSRFTKLDSNVLESIEVIDKITLDILCDCLVGDTHHKRRQTLASIQFRCHELVVCIIHMLGSIMNMETTSNQDQDQCQSYPIDITRFLMYLYNNNPEFQSYCKRSDELIVALSESMMKPQVDSSETKRAITIHPASKEILELSRIIILDQLTDSQLQSMDPDSSKVDNLHAFETFLTSLASCKEAQGELVDMLLKQTLLMIDSTARHNNIQTIASSDNIQQFQMLLVNSISISQIVTDKIWLQELYCDNLNRVLSIMDYQLCLAEQIFKFNEILPRNNPPHAFLVQRVLNRIILFALSRPMNYISDKMLMLDLLKKIHDNRTIIILNHMHSPQSAEFFVCFAYCLLRVIEENTITGSATGSSTLEEQPTSLIERQYGHLSSQPRSLDMNLNGPSSSDLMLVSMARKVWDAIYQSKKGLLSEAFDVSLSLPAFTLDTSLDLLQLKPDIQECCERYWSSFVESEQKPRRRIQPKLSETGSGSVSGGSSAVNILSGRLTRVVNAANFVSRVVGATAGTMASNVNLVGEKLAQTRGATRTSSKQMGDTTNPTNTNQSLSGQNVNNASTSFTSYCDQSDLFRYPQMSKEQSDEASKTHIFIIKDYIETHISQKNHKLALHKYLCDEWLDIEYEVLLRERALFGPDYGSKLDKWCLDLTEGPRRMRKKMVNNSRQFYENYPYTPEQFNPSNKSLRYRPPMSYDSHLYYIKTLELDKQLLDIDEGKPTTENAADTVSCFDNLSTEKNTPSPCLLKVADNDDQEKSSSNHVDPTSPARSPIDRHSSIESFSSALNIQANPNQRLAGDQGENGRLTRQSSEIDLDDGDMSFVDFSPEIEAETNSARELENLDSLSVLRLLEKNERISHMFRCSRVQGLDTYEGLLLFGREHFYLIDGFTLLKTREIKDIDSLPPEAHDPIIPNSTPNITHSKKTCTKFSFDSVVEVHKRRYLLQPIALELFSSDGRNTLIVFPRNIRNKVYTRLIAVSTQLTNNAHESLAGQKSNVSVEGGSNLLSNLIGETSVTQRWVRGELSNFQYLMNLNTIAGRSYNDLMQYPIFPWILADYTSDCLDLSKPSTFRDLSRPVGAQTSDRLEQFKRRYAEWDDTETPPYHYGTFYSSAMIVASYMVRMEPFTQHFLRLQGGHFDLADRMFHSINDSWLSASKHNMADIKELIPEFFYLPEFLKNENKYDLGIKQNGMKLDDVLLPPWAKNDPREFIRLHRCALESDYVSAHLHEWIDLIFGYKQQGQPAVDAVNVFHHLFYEGNVDIYNTDIDPIKKNAVIGFINNFGQVPKQLFKKPHPTRKLTGVAFTQGPAAMPLTPILPSLTVTAGATSVHRLLTHCPQALRQLSAAHKDLRGPVGQIVQMDRNVVAVEQNKLLIPPEYCRYVAWGHADRSLRLGLYDSEKPIFIWEGSDNMAPNEILCCTIPNNRIMITAGTESLITVWKIEKMKSFAPVLHLYGHVEPVTCLASSQSYSIIVSGSRDRTAIIWDLNKFTFTRQLGGGPPDKLVHHGPISAISINDSTGDIATAASSWLYLWTINGALLAQIDTVSVAIQQSMMGNSSISSNLSQLHILSVCFSQQNEWDLDEVIVTGASDGSVAIWSMRYYQSPLSQVEIEEAKLKAKRSTIKRENEVSEDAEPPQAPASNSGGSITNNKDSDNEEDVQDEGKPRQASEPINIRPKGRQRTDTMNSDWVRLSTSSTSTCSIVPVARATPSDQSFNERSISPDPIELGRDVRTPRCSTPNAETTGPLEFASREDDLVGESSIAFNDTLDDVGRSMSKANLLLTPNDPSFIKFSKSDTSLVDSFVVLGGDASQLSNSSLNQTPVATGDRQQRPQSSTGVSHPTPQRRKNKLSCSPGDRDKRAKSGSKLLLNHCWRRELYLRYLLPRRNSNNKALPPPGVTSLAISKDTRTLFVGDFSGKVSSWSTQ